MSQRSNARGRQRHAPISEAAIRESVEALDWTKLEKALRLVPARDFDISAICDSIRHCTSIIFRYPNAARERRRDAFFQSLADYVVLRQEKGADQTVRDLVALVTLIEKGYWSILDLLKQTIAAKKPASESIAAILSLGAHQTSAMLKAAFEQARAAEVFEPAAIALTDANGAVYAAEEITEMVSVTTSLSLIMYAVQQHWIAPDGTIVLPALPRVGDVERTYADDVQKLAEAWAFWRMIEERCRYEGGDIEALFENMNDGGSSDDIVLSYRPSKDANEWERRTVANYERLNTEVSSIHHHLAFRTDARLRVKNAAEEEISLFPTSFISLTELQSAHALDFMLSTQIAIESTRYLGLRLTEWLRGYSALQLMASKLVDGETRNPDLLIWKVEPKALQRDLVRLGLTATRAESFINHVTFRRTSVDMVDEPLIRLEGDKLLVFGPSLIDIVPARIIASKLTRDSVQLTTRGRRFEDDVRRWFTHWGLQPHAFTIQRGGEEYEYDVVVPWGEYVFMFECKSRGLVTPGVVQRHHAKAKLRSYLAQAERLAEELRENPEALDKQIGTASHKRIVVPCILNALPFGFPGAMNGIYCTDMSSLGIFFERGTVALSVTHCVPGLPSMQQRLAELPLWAGSKPTPEDLMRLLEEAPLAVIAMSQLEESVARVKLGLHLYAEAPQVSTKPSGIDELSRLIGLDPKATKQEVRLVADGLAGLAIAEESGPVES